MVIIVQRKFLNCSNDLNCICNNFIFRNLQILFDNVELLQEIFSKRNILFFFRFVWVWKSIEYSLELRKKQNLGPAPSLLFWSMEKISLKKLIQKDFKGDFDRRETPFFPPNFRKDYSEENRALAWEERSGPPRPFPLIWKGMVQNLFVYVCVILEIIKRKTLYLFKPNLPPPSFPGLKYTLQIAYERTWDQRK